MVTYAPLMNDFFSPCQWRKVVWHTYLLNHSGLWVCKFLCCHRTAGWAYIQSRQHSPSGYRTTQDHKKKNCHCQRRAEQQSPTATVWKYEFWTTKSKYLATMKGGSSWLTTLPLKSENFNLNKREFYDVLSLRYRWTPKYLPSMCPCGKRFDVDHAM